MKANMAISYPGSNKVKLSTESVMRMVQDELDNLSEGIRVTDVTMGYGGMEVTFTTDKPESNDIQRYSDALDLVARWDDEKKKFGPKKPKDNPAVITTGNAA
jgi:hypothetical protein